MAYCTLEDLSGAIELLVFPKVLEQYRPLLVQDNLVLVSGRYNEQEENSKIFCEKLTPLLEQNVSGDVPQSSSNLQALAKEAKTKLYLRLEGGNASQEIQDVLKMILLKHPGEIPVYFYFPQEKKMLLAEKRFWCNCDGGILTALGNLLGMENLQLK